MEKFYKQISRYHCSNLYCIITDMEGNHLKDCRTKNKFDDFVIGNNGIFVKVTDELTIFQSHSICELNLN